MAGDSAPSMGDVLYHGTDEELDELDGHNPGYEGSLGYGLYMTTDASFAETFGRNIHRAAAPVPDELVAFIDPSLHDCGDPLTIYTPGSSPFTFSLEHRVTGEKRVYSVLGNCEWTVKSRLMAEAVASYRPSRAVADAVRASCPAGGAASKAWDEAVASVTDDTSRGYGKRIDEELERVIDGWDEEERGEELTDRQASALAAAGRECADHCESRLAESLGDELDLDDLSSVCESLGYSAFYISGYAPGDEYVIFDDAYLPVPVIGFERVR